MTGSTSSYPPGGRGGGAGSSGRIYQRTARVGLYIYVWAKKTRIGARGCSPMQAGSSRCKSRFGCARRLSRAAPRDARPSKKRSGRGRPNCASARLACRKLGARARCSGVRVPRVCTKCARYYIGACAPVNRGIADKRPPRPRPFRSAAAADI